MTSDRSLSLLVTVTAACYIMTGHRVRTLVMVCQNAQLVVRLFSFIALLLLGRLICNADIYVICLHLPTLMLLLTQASA